MVTFAQRAKNCLAAEHKRAVPTDGLPCKLATMPFRYRQERVCGDNPGFLSRGTLTGTAINMEKRWPQIVLSQLRYPLLVPAG
jgi:hypothetical protein